MIQHPPDHKFRAKTRSCPCEDCGGVVRAPWHYSETTAKVKALGVEPELIEEVTVKIFFLPDKVRIVFPESSFSHSDHIQLVEMVGTACADDPSFAVRRGHDLVISEE
jgi:hypothetical protein